MKKKTYALLVALCLCCSAVFFTACNDKDKISTTSKLSLDNYAVSITEARENELLSGSTAGYTSAEELEWSVQSSYRSKNSLRIEKDGLYGYYNYALGKTVVPVEYESYSLNSYDSFILGNGTSESAVYSADGTVLLYSDSAIYVQTHSTPIYYYARKPITHTLTYSESGETKHAYIYNNDNGYARCASDTQVKPKDLPTTDGTLLFRSEATLWGIGNDDAFLADYTVSYEDNSAGGRTYYFSKGNKTTKLSLPDNLHGMHYGDGKILYGIVVQLPHDATSGYNYVSTPSNFTQTVKYNITYYSFDIATGKTSALHLGYIISSVIPLYNNTAKCYDAFAVKAIRLQNGIAKYSAANDLQTFIIDATGKVGYDLTNYGNCEANKIIRLRNNRYLLSSNQSSYIIDGNGKAVAYLGNKTSNVAQAAELIVTTDSTTGRKGAVDFNGRLALDYRYDTLNFYGTTALTQVYTLESAETKFVTADHPDGKDIEDVLPLAEGETRWTSLHPNGLIVTAKNDGTTRYTVYNYTGTELFSLEADSLLSVSSEWSFANGMILRAECRSGYEFVTKYFLVK